MGIICIQALRQRHFGQLIAMAVGFAIPISTFVLFDMTHPPGLFFGHYLGNNIVSNGLPQRLTNFVPMFASNGYASFYYLTQSSVLALLTIVCFVLLALRDIVAKRTLVYLLPVFAQILALSFVPTYQDRYVLLSIVYLFAWLAYPRVKVVDRVLAKVMLLVMVVGGIATLRTNLTVPIAQPSGNVVAQVTSYMKREIADQELKNVNVAVLASADREPLALIYRDMAHINGFTLLDKSEYWKSDTLFIISTSDEVSIRTDQANVMEGFRSGPLKSKFSVPNSNWLVYRFTRR